MTIANVHQAKTNLSKLLNAARSGEEVVIKRRGDSLEYALQARPKAKSPRIFGLLKGKIHYAPDYDKADAEILQMIEDGMAEEE